MLVELAKTVNEGTDVCVVDKRARVVVMVELNQQDDVTLVFISILHSILQRDVFEVFVRWATTCVHFYIEIALYI